MNINFFMTDGGAPSPSDAEAIHSSVDAMLRELTLHQRREELRQKLSTTWNPAARAAISRDLSLLNDVLRFPHCLISQVECMLRLAETGVVISPNTQTQYVSVTRRSISRAFTHRLTDSVPAATSDLRGSALRLVVADYHSFNFHEVRVTDTHVYVSTRSPDSRVTVCMLSKDVESTVEELYNVAVGPEEEE